MFGNLQYLAAQPAAHVRYAPARQRRRPARHSGTPRPRTPLLNADLHARLDGKTHRGLRQRPSEGVADRDSCFRRLAFVQSKYSETSSPSSNFLSSSFALILVSFFIHSPDGVTTVTSGNSAANCSSGFESSSPRIGRFPTFALNCPLSS